MVAAAMLGLAGCSGKEAARGLQQQTTNDDGTDTVPPPVSDGSDRGGHAQPGEVQEAIDAVADRPASMVTLEPGARYDPDSTWTVKSGVTLDYNGAYVRLSRDVDLHDIQPGGQVRDPMIDLREVFGGYSSSVFRFDSGKFGFYGANRHWHVRGGFTRGVTGEGTLYEFRQGRENAIYFVHVDHCVWNVGTVVEMHRGDRFGINGNRIYGVWRGFEKGIHMYNRNKMSENVNNNSGNYFDVVAQPRDSTMLWDMEIGRFNIVRGQIWDSSAYSDVLWRLHDGNAGDDRVGNIFYWFPLLGSREYLLDSNNASQFFDDRIGSSKNRVVSPLWLGEPVSELTG
jgi:hypothetical protein